MSSDKAKMTRAAMLRSARELIVERGIDRLSMDQLALRCEKSKGAVMYHFKTRRALLQALIEEYAEHMTERLRRNEAWAVANLSDPERDDEEARARALIAAYVRWLGAGGGESSGARLARSGTLGTRARLVPAAHRAGRSASLPDSLQGDLLPHGDGGALLYPQVFARRHDGRSEGGRLLRNARASRPRLNRGALVAASVLRRRSLPSSSFCKIFDRSVGKLVKMPRYLFLAL